MRGDDTLWLPGVDHASIAAQFVLDRIIAEEGETPRLARPRALPRADVAVHGRDARRHRRAAPSPRGEPRLDAAALHDGRRQRACRARRLQAAVGRRARLPRRGPRQLVPALPDDDQRPREHPPRGDRDAVDDPLPPRARGWDAGPGPVDQRGDHSPRDDPRRHRGRGPSRRRSLPRPRRARGDPAVPAVAGCRSSPIASVERDVRHRCGEDHAGARLRRLRARPAATACR